MIFNLPTIAYKPYLSTPSPSTYPFVVDVNLSIQGDADTTIVGSEPVTFTVTFNRDMDTAIQPAVSFGPDAPITDYTIHPIDGGWQDLRTWQGVFNVNPITGDGYQLIRVAGAVAMDDPWLVTGDDAGPFRFEIITSGTAAMNLQATGGEGCVDLIWSQDDFDLLAGYNLYSSTSQAGPFSRINSSIIPPDIHSWREINVVPGQSYYYYFTVVKSDMSESAQSNIATAIPTDTISPIISHTPIATTSPGLPLTIYADVTDNVGVQSVTLFHRHIGDATYSTRSMAHTTENRYAATLEGSLLYSPGMEYYIEAGDGVGTALSGRREFPYQVIVIDRPIPTIVTPNHGTTAGGTPVTIAGSNFKEGVTVSFGGAAASDVLFVSSSQISCSTPNHYPETVDIKVTNPDAQSGTLLRGFTYESDTASISLPDTGGGQNEIVQLPVYLANAQGLAAASFTVTFDNSILHATGAHLGNLIPGWSLVSNTTIPGQVRISMASSGGTTTGSGVLAYFDFEVVGSPGAMSVLSLSNILLNDGAIPVQTADGSFNVDLVYSISGTIQFWNGGVVSATQMTLEGDRLYSGLSKADGAFQVSGAATGDYILTPEKTSETNGISAYDASLVLQHDAGLITLGGYEATAADVNNSGAISSMDAFYIMQKSVDLINLPFPGAGLVWNFSPTNRSYTGLSSDLIDQNFQAILLGDPSGSWIPGSDPQMSPPLNIPELVSATLSIPFVDVLPGEIFTIPLNIDLNSGQVFGVDIEIAYDSYVVTPTRVLRGSLATGWSLVSNLNDPGLIRIAMAGAIPIVEDGEMLQIVFEAADQTDLSTDLSLINGELNEGQISTVLQSGSVNIASPVHSNFSASPTSGPAPLNVSFTNLSSGDFTDSLWDFGDGFTSTAGNPTHSYSVPGVYTVTLTISGPGGSNTFAQPNYINAYSLKVSGKVSFWANNIGLRDVDLSFDGVNNYSTITSPTGLFTITNILAGDYTLTPEKTDEANGITAYDASLVLQHVAGLSNLTGYLAVAADVDESGSVGTMDASNILQKAVGLIGVPFPGVASVWKFDPQNITYTNLNENADNQDFTGILLGDPSGNWQPDESPQPSIVSQAPALLSITTGSIQSSGLVTASVILEPDASEIFGVDLLLEFDPTQLEIVDVEQGEIAQGWMFAKNTQPSGEIRIGLANSLPLASGGIITQIAFQKIGQANNTLLHFSSGMLNEGDVEAVLQDGFINSLTSVYLPVIRK